MKDKASAVDIAIGHTMSGYWVAFVRTGDPNGVGRVEWPRYDPISSNVLNFTNTGATFGVDPLQARLDLWQSIWEIEPPEHPQGSRIKPQAAEIINRLFSPSYGV